MKYAVKVTTRGFRYVEFDDHNKNSCTLQQSSLANEHAIWLGISEPTVKLFVTNSAQPWQEVSTAELKSLRHGAESVLISARMHLTRQQVKALLPFLNHFAETGEI